MRMNRSIVTVAALALCGVASAQSGDSSLQISGFGTLAYVVTDTDSAVYGTGGQPKGATTTGSLMPDSRIGIQASAKMNDTFSGTVQIFSKQDSAGSFDPVVEWAFVKAKLGKDFTVRAGRMGAPFFMTSDFRAVGYTNLTVRTSPEVYALVPVRSFDGADVLYQTELRDTIINAQLWTGNTRLLNAVDTYVLLKESVGISISAETGPFTLRFGTMQTTLDIDGAGPSAAGLKSITNGLNALSAQPGLGSLRTTAADLGVANQPATFTGLGLVYDSGKWVFNTEFVKRTSGSLFVATVDAWYTTLGYRVGKFTPYVSLAGRNQSSAKSVVAPPTAGFPPQVVGTVAALIAGANSAVVPDATTSSVAVGSRWDLGKTYALKGEVMQLNVPAGANGYLPRVPLGPTGRARSDLSINVISLAVDFVF